MTPREIATTFLKMAAGGDVRAAYDRFVSPSFIHHNAYFRGDRESLLLAMEQAHRTSPNKSLEVKRVVVSCGESHDVSRGESQDEGDLVVTHSLVTRARSEQSPIAVVHIFRIERGKIAELWDVGQEIPKDSPNEYGPF